MDFGGKTNVPKDVLHCTMGQGPEKIDLSRFESWDLFQNDQHKLHFTLDIAVIVRNCAVQ